jgi:hypothetical protein
MNKIHAIEHVEQKIRDLEHQLFLIRNIPLKTPLLIDLSYWETNIKAVVEVISFNSESIRFKFYATSGDLGWWSLKKTGTDHIKYPNISDFLIFPDAELPLLLGWAVTFPALAERLKQ